MERTNYEIVLIKIDINVSIDQTVVIGECHTEVGLSMDKIVEEGHSMIKVYRGDFRKGISRGTQHYRGKNFKDGYR